MTLDFYLRVSLVELQRMSFEHLETAMDVGDEPLFDSIRLSSPPGMTSLCGYTEWASADEPSASLGWDWVMPLTASEVVLRRHSIRTNLRVVSMDGAALGMSYSLEMLRTIIDTLPWKERVLQSLCCGDPRPLAPRSAYL
jgi:hypothetical protein